MWIFISYKRVFSSKYSRTFCFFANKKCKKLQFLPCPKNLLCNKIVIMYRIWVKSGQRYTNIILLYERGAKDFIEFTIIVFLDSWASFYLPCLLPTPYLSSHYHSLRRSRDDLASATYDDCLLPHREIYFYLWFFLLEWQGRRLALSPSSCFLPSPITENWYIRKNNI